MADLSTQVKIAQATAILLATTTGSINAGLSIFAVPRILDSSSPKIVTEQWGCMFQSAKTLLTVPMVILPGLANGFLAYRLPEKSQFYMTLAIATFSILPWNALAMSPTEWKMERRLRQAKAYGGGDGPLLREVTSSGVTETAHSVVRAWGFRNLFRCAVSLIAGCAGLYAVLV